MTLQKPMFIIGGGIIESVAASLSIFFGILFQRAGSALDQIWKVIQDLAI